ncbi:MAG: DUF4625 domain-containing protein [Cytophagales bacterium]|nr:MAG: DUF4625 domain-containing protein [Cytophagales bacterium]
MKKKYSTIFILFYLIGIYIMSCISSCVNKNVEPEVNTKEKPTISIVSQNIPSVTAPLCKASFDNVLKINTGVDLKIKFRFRAANNLSEYKVDAHNNFDCHTHRKRVLTKPWKLLKIVSLQGKDVLIEETITIPTDASAGNYHLIFQLIDDLGNEAVPVEFNVIILNSNDTISPTIELTQPSIDSISVARGNMLNIAGIIGDNISLNGGKVEISYIDSAGTQFDIEQLNFSPTQGNKYLLNYNYIIPSFSVKGASVFYIRAFDEVNNVTSKQLKVMIN